MSFFSFEVGEGSGGDALNYPTRTMVRDEQERLRTDREENQGRQPERSGEAEDDPVPYLLSEDSPLILINIPDYVINPESAIQEIKARVYGMSGAKNGRQERLFDERGKALYQAAPLREMGAEALMVRLRTFVAVDSHIIERMKRRGNPKGRTRKFYNILTSPDRPLSNHEIKRPLLRLYEERLPLARLIGYIHGDTEHAHPHAWQSARLASGYKFHIGKERVNGEWVDRFKDLGDTYVRFYAEQVNDPSLVGKYLAKKREWSEKRARIEEALEKGIRPPAMPFRERHLYDELGERRERRERRRLEANGEEPGSKKKAAPVARCRRTWECAELWGKLIHAAALSEDAHERLSEFELTHHQMEFTVNGQAWSLERINRERDVLFARHQPEGGLTAQEEKRASQLSHAEEGVSGELEARRESLLQELVETDIRYRQFIAAWDKTVENRLREKLPEIKYPLPNTRQLEEINKITERYFSVEMRRYTHTYELLDYPADREGLAHAFSARWGQEVMAEVAVHEQAQRLLTRTREDAAPNSTDESRRGAGTSSRHAVDDEMRHRMFEEWIQSRWDAQDMRRALPCIRNENLQQQAKIYLKAREYQEAAKEILGDYREGMETARLPLLDIGEIARIRALLQIKGAVHDKEVGARLELIADLMAQEVEPTRAEWRRMIEPSFHESTSPLRQSGRSRAVSPAEDYKVSRPFDDHWVARIFSMMDLTATRALAAAMRHNGTREKMGTVRDEAIEIREKLDLTRWVRAQTGLGDPPVVRIPLAERNEMNNLERFIRQQLIREPQWTPDQIEQIKEFERWVPAKSRDDYTAALEKALEHLQRTKEEKEKECMTLFEERVIKLNQSLNERDTRYSIEAFTTMSLEDAGRSEAITEKSRGLAASYQQIIQNHGFSPEQVNEKELLQRSRAVVSETIDLAERLRDTMFIALLDNPTMRELDERMSAVGIDLDIRQAKDRRVMGIDLRYKDYTIDTGALSPRLTGRVIADNADAASEKRYGSKLERMIHRCLEMSMASESERARILDAMTPKSWPPTTKEIENSFATKYALLVVCEVRAGGERTWEAVDQKIRDAGQSKERETREHLIKCWSVTRHLEVEQREKERMAYRPVVQESRTRELTRAMGDHGRSSRSSANRSSYRGR